MTLAADHSSYILRESLISAVINAAISLGFFLALFGLGAPVGGWGIGNYVFDFLPQGFAVAFFGSLIPSLMTAKALRKGAIVAAKDAFPSGQAMLAASIQNGVAAALLGTAFFAALFWLAGLEDIAAVPALAIKLGYGAVLGAVATSLTLRKMLGVR